MRIGVAATPQVAIPTLDWLLTTDHELALVITQPDKPAGRGRELKQSPVSEWAGIHGVTTLKPESSASLVEHLESLDVVITIGYGVILPESILKLPKFGFINLHFSLLPAYRGAAPVQRAIENGEEVTGLTVFQLDKGMDTGPVFTSMAVNIEPQWRSHEALEHLAQLGPVAISSSLESISLGVKPQAQAGQATMAPKISKAEAEINWRHNNRTIVNKIRAFYPAPCAWTLWNGTAVKITNARIHDAIEELEPGQVLFHNKKLLVGAENSCAVELVSVIPSGKNEMAAADWARGAHLHGGEYFG